MQMQVPSLAPLSGFKDLAWLWLWRRREGAALIGPLAWELPYALPWVQPEKAKKKKKKAMKSLLCARLPNLYRQLRSDLHTVTICLLVFPGVSHWTCRKQTRSLPLLLGW